MDNPSPSDLKLLLEKGFVLDSAVGSGSYSKVYRVSQANHSAHPPLCCKVIDTATAPREYLKKFLPRELDILIRVSHPHIAHVTHIFQHRAKYFLFMRYGERGDLFEYIVHNGCINESQSRLWMRQLISALQYIHTMNIAHRDLKCENVIITSGFNVKLSDFGFSRIVCHKGIDVLSETFCGTLSYTAPEVLKGAPYLPKLADMWSMGIILYTMLNQSLPFSETSAKVLYQKQVQMKRQWRFSNAVVNVLSTECKEQVNQLMEPDAAQRPSAECVIKGEWICKERRLRRLSSMEETSLKKAVETAQNQLNSDEHEIDGLNCPLTQTEDGLKSLKESSLTSELSDIS